VKYNQKSNAKYSGQPDRPVESMMWKNKFWFAQLAKKIFYKGHICCCDAILIKPCIQIKGDFFFYSLNQGLTLRF
jgi:hypothetical protein